MMTVGSSYRLPPQSDVVRISDDKPILLAVIDTEEEFDWTAGFDRQATSVKAMRRIGLAQEAFDEFGGRPTYVVDFPVAHQPEGFTPLLEPAQEGRAVIGAHLHPWVTPPHDEEVNARNSFAGNLPPALEREKLRRLVDQITESFGERPTIYKAGRYGIGPNTPSILEQEGFEVDLSPNPPYDASAEEGPDFSDLTADPYWFGEERRMLSLPATGSYIGLLHRSGPKVYSWAQGVWGKRLHAGGILSRLGLLDRLHLSPEGFSIDELRRLTSFLHRRGQRVFAFSFHSPSMEPGCTPYVQNVRDREVLLDRCRRYFDFFLGTLGGVWTTPVELKCHLEQTEGTDQK